MTRRTTATIAIAAAFAMIMLAGCTPTDPEPTGSATPKPTPSATPTGDPVQEPSDAPASAEEAVAGAAATYSAYEELWFKLLANPELGADYTSGYVLPGSPARQSVEDTLRINAEQGIYVEGDPFIFTPNEALSYTSPVTDPKTGEVTEFGGVILYGCVDNNPVDFKAKEGFEDPGFPKMIFPVEVTMAFSSETQAWMIQSDRSLLGQEGAPLC